MTLRGLRKKLGPLDGLRGLAAPSQGGGVAPIVQPLRVVTTRGEVEADLILSGLTADNNAQGFRVRVYAGAGGIAANSMQLRVPNFAVTAAATETDASAHKIGGHIEFGGVAYPFAFGGSQLGDVPAGEADFGSDTLTHPAVPEGTECFAYIYREYAVGGSYTYLHGVAPTPAITGEGSFSGAAGTVSNRIGTPGTLGATGGWSNIYFRMNIPFAIIGRQITKERAFVIVGASLEKYQSDTWGDGANGAGGYIRRGLNPASGRKYAFISLARTSEAAFQFNAGSAKRRQWLKYGNTGINGYGGNDFSFNVSPASLINHMATIKGYMVDAGMEDFIYSRMAAKTNSTDNWATIENQTFRVGASITLPNYRSQIDAAVVSQGYRLFSGATASDEDAANPGFWKANGTASYATADGIHRTPLFHGNAGAALQNYVASLPALAA